MFKVVTQFTPTQAQDKAAIQLATGLQSNQGPALLEGVTGSGKTLVMARTIENLQRATLVLAQNKTLAAQLYSELRQFFPKNVVCYFVSYFDYYRPEAYLPAQNKYLEKESMINDVIEQWRMHTLVSLLTRSDVIVVATVSAIYGLGSPETYKACSLKLTRGQVISREALLFELVKLQYERTSDKPSTGQFRVQGDTIDLVSCHVDQPVRINLEESYIDTIKDHANNTQLEELVIYPRKPYQVEQASLPLIISQIRTELDSRLLELKDSPELAQRLKDRITYDIAMLELQGFCSGVENYARYFTSRLTGERPFCLLDYFPKDFLTIIDESHITIPQIKGMYTGDRKRKDTLVQYGFRLPSCLDNRPLTYAEFKSLIDSRVLFVSATPNQYELSESKTHARLLVRPTGIIDPLPNYVETDNPFTHILDTIKAQPDNAQLIITTTQTSAEQIHRFLRKKKLKSAYLHAKIDSVERTEILRDFNAHRTNILVGVNLLREGIDLPRLAVVHILDCDAEGFLRSETSLLQISGRAARNIHGQVFLYARKLTPNVTNFLKITNERRSVQLAHNKAYNVTPQPITRLNPQDSLSREKPNKSTDLNVLEGQMLKAAEELNFEKAALLRNQIQRLKSTTSNPLPR